MTEEPIRLHKWISRLGIASRREAESWIRDGRVAVDGEPAAIGQTIVPGEHVVTVDGEELPEEAPPHVYWLLHKPDRTLTSRPDGTDRPTIFELPRLRKLNFRVYTVGRLDFRTEGLLLLTNDGELSHRLAHPSYEIPRTYRALITPPLTRDELTQMRKGVELEDGPVGKVRISPIQGQNLGASRGRWYEVTVHEGRNRLVRRLFEHCERKVVRLVRVGYGPMELPEDLAVGEYRQLSSKEVHALKRATGLH